MKDERRKQILFLIDFLKENKKKLIIDADTHISDLSNISKEAYAKYISSDNYYQGKPIGAQQLINEMDMSGVNMSLCWLNPAAIKYTNSHQENYKKLCGAIDYIIDASVKYPTRIIPTGWIDPKALGMEKSRKLIKRCISNQRLAVIKMNPAQNEYDLDHPDVRELSEEIATLGGIPAFHYGADTKYTPPESLAALAKFLYPHKLIAVHMGGGGASYMEGEEMYKKTRELGLQHENIYFIESAKRDTHIESDFITYIAAGEAHYKRICCASDAPYGRQSWNYGGYKAMFSTLANTRKHTDKRIKDKEVVFTDEIGQRFLGENLAELLIEAHMRMLQ